MAEGITEKENISGAPSTDNKGMLGLERGR